MKERFDENLVWLMDCEFYYRLKNKYGNPIYLHEPIRGEIS